MKPKFKALNWDGGEFFKLGTRDIVQAIYMSWNYEFDLYTIKPEKRIFSGNLDNKQNSKLLRKYDVSLVDTKEGRRLQSIVTGEIFKPTWEK